MSLLPESLINGFLAFVDKIDPPAEVEQASDVEQFELLSKRNHAGVVHAVLVVEEAEPRVFRLHTRYASWVGDQAGKVVVDEPYSEGYRGSLEDGAWNTFRLKMALAAEKKLREISGLLPRARIIMGLQTKRIDGSGDYNIIAPDQRNQLYDEAMRRGLSSLTPVQQIP